MVCGEVLVYLEKTPKQVTCEHCQKSEYTYIHCPHGHYVCDDCHNRTVLGRIKKLILMSRLLDPVAIAVQAMDIPELPMLGCHYAYIAGGALMVAIRNKGTIVVSDDDVQEVFVRTSMQAHGGYCGLTGVCGIAPAVGACVAILSGSKCGEDQPQFQTMTAVTRVVQAITALTGPSCCQAYVLTTLQVMIPFLREQFAIRLPQGDVPACHKSALHPHGCRTEQCPWYAT